MNLIHVLSVVALSFASLGWAPLAAADEPPPPAAFVAAGDTNEAPLVVMTLNVHGSEDVHGGGNRGRWGAIAVDVLALTREHTPDVIALQELCGRQYRALRSKLARLGYSGTMTVARRSGGCNDRARGNKYGVALFVKGKIGSRSSWALPWGQNAEGSRGVQARRLLCVKPSAADWRACVVHLATADPDRGVQASVVASRVARWAGGRLVVTGDFNMGAEDVAAVFPGFTVSGSRIDHVVSTGPSSVVSVVPVASSDHPALVAAA